MFEFTNECVGCEHCDNCGADRTPNLACDNCGSDCDEVYFYDETQEVCVDCLLALVKANECVSKFDECDNEVWYYQDKLYENEDELDECIIFNHDKCTLEEYIRDRLDEIWLWCKL